MDVSQALKLFCRSRLQGDDERMAFIFYHGIHSHAGFHKLAHERFCFVHIIYRYILYMCYSGAGTYV